MPDTTYDGATEAELAETVAMVENLGRRVVSRVGDVRNVPDVEAAVREGIEQFEHIDVLVCNAGVTMIGRGWEITEEAWSDQIEINLIGCWRFAR